MCGSSTPGIFPSVKKKQTIFTQNNLYESQEHYLEWKKPISKSQILYEFNYIIFSKWQITVMENEWFQEVRAGVYKKK